MDKYIRLTERCGNGICIKETSKNDNKSIWNAIERLAELEDKLEDGRLWEAKYLEPRPHPFECAERWAELWYEANCQLNALKDKIENGTLIELPRIIHPNRMEWYVQYQYPNGVIQYYICFSEAEAEAKLKELKGE